MNNLYEVLEICLNEIEQGADVDTVLFRYPEYADELRPIIKASVSAKEMTVSAPSQDVVKRNRAKLLQYAVEIREQNTAPSRRIWSVPLRRALVTLTVIMMLFVSSTGLVRASSTTLPGDNLYPVKRTWEDVSLFFTFNTTKRSELELEYETERLDELHELFAEGRSANVDFAGYVTRQNGTEWRVSGITVLISPETHLPAQPVEINAAVRVKGQAQSNMDVFAESVELLPSGSKLPEVKDNELENDSEEPEGSNLQIVEASTPVPESETPEVKTIVTSTPETETTVMSTPEAEITVISTPDAEPEKISIKGIVNSAENDFIVVSGTVMNIRFAEVKGTPSIGVTAEAEGYFGTDGVFIATKIEFKDSSSSSGSGSSNDNTSSDDNSNDVHSNDD